MNSPSVPLPFRLLPAAAVIAVFFAIPVPMARAMVFWNADNSANQSDPGTGVQWGAVARVAGASLDLSSTTGTALHLGGGYMLTADHVTLTSSQRITFDGINALTINMSFNGGTGYQTVAAGVDLKVFRLTSDPGEPAVLLSDVYGLTYNATMIGYGVGRNETSTPGTSPVGWGNSTTIAKRWGLNVPLGITGITYGSYSYNATYTVAGANPASPPGVGNYEAALTLMDSGSGLFQYTSGQWLLIGVAATVEQQAGTNTSTFGNDTISGSGRGDRNFFVPIAPYRDTILAIIPEPGSVFLFGVGIGALLLLRRRAR